MTILFVCPTKLILMCYTVKHSVNNGVFVYLVAKEEFSESLVFSEL